jgi:prepilin signal peptidase PulO-like enzyme (type II secretory pathway)
MAYRIPSDEEVLSAIKNVMNSRGIVNSQTKLKDLVERELHITDDKYHVSPRRLRMLALSSDHVRVEIHCRESDKKKAASRCPVCNHRLKLLKNKTIFNGVVIIGHECTHCSYWTGLKRRIPIRYIFTSR